MMHFLGAIGAFVTHLAVAVALIGVFVLGYMRTTPHDELGQVRRGNTAAALAIGGALIGYALVLARAISFSDGILETMLWGLIGLGVQVFAHMLLARFIPRLYTAIEEGDVAAGVMTAAVAITFGLLNAASMTP